MGQCLRYGCVGERPRGCGKIDPIDGHYALIIKRGMVW